MLYNVYIDVKASVGIKVTAGSFDEAIERARKRTNGKIWAPGVEYNDGSMRISGVFEENNFDTSFDND